MRKVLSSILAEKADLSIYTPMLAAIEALPESPTKIQLFDLTFSVQSTGTGLGDLAALIQTLPADQQQPAPRRICAY